MFFKKIVSYRERVTFYYQSHVMFQEKSNWKNKGQLLQNLNKISSLLTEFCSQYHLHWFLLVSSPPSVDPAQELRSP